MDILLYFKPFNSSIIVKTHLFIWICCSLIKTAYTQPARESNSRDSIVKVKKTVDFIITGNGNAPQWNQTDWTNLPQTGGKPTEYKTQFKILYSDTGIYCLFNCGDRKITATRNADFLDLYNEDVIEAFFHPDESQPLYFEYELSPLNYELPIIVPNFKGRFYGWRPWNYDGARKTRHATYIEKDGKTVLSWKAEFFIPYALLSPLPKVPPAKGMRWRANFYRIDYDDKDAEWSWQLTKTNFHDYERFGTLEFD